MAPNILSIVIRFPVTYHKSFYHACVYGIIGRKCPPMLFLPLYSLRIQMKIEKGAFETFPILDWDTVAVCKLIIYTKEECRVNSFIIYYK